MLDNFCPTFWRNLRQRLTHKGVHIFQVVLRWATLQPEAIPKWSQEESLQEQQQWKPARPDTSPQRRSLHACMHMKRPCQPLQKFSWANEKPHENLHELLGTEGESSWALLEILWNLMRYSEILMRFSWDLSFHVKFGTNSHENWASHENSHEICLSCREILMRVLVRILMRFSWDSHDDAQNLMRFSWGYSNLRDILMRFSWDHSICREVLMRKTKTSWDSYEQNPNLTRSSWDPHEVFMKSSWGQSKSHEVSKEH